MGDTSVTTFTCPQKSSPPHSRDSQGLMPDQDQVLAPEAAVSATNPQMVTVPHTEELPELLMAIRLELPDLDPPPWNSEEDLVEARRNKFIMSKFKKKKKKKKKKKS